MARKKLTIQDKIISDLKKQIVILSQENELLRIKLFALKRQYNALINTPSLEEIFGEQVSEEQKEFENLILNSNIEKLLK